MTFNVECTKQNIAGAIYCITDMIIFQEYKEIAGDSKYLEVIVTIDDINEEQAIYKWSDIPEHIFDIYEYVSKTSSMTDNVLRGNHLGRVRDYKMEIARFPTNPINDCELQIINTKDNKQLYDIAYEICDNMKTVKKM